MFRAIMVAIAALLCSAALAFANEPARIVDPGTYGDEAMEVLTKKSPRDVGKMIAKTIGKPEVSETLENVLGILDGKKFDFIKKVVDNQYAGALRQLIYYSYVENLGFVYFRFNFKMTSTGWVLSNFAFKDEAMELFPKAFDPK